MTTALEITSESRCFGGVQRVYRVQSEACACPMAFAAFIPPQAEHEPRPALFWLSGLTCTWENFTVKAGAQRKAAELGLVLIAPDTSPRGEGVADDAAYDFGQGAGFYVDATEAPWASHFAMETHVAQELPALIAGRLPIDMSRIGIAGHSMGGHGALTLAMRHPDRFRSLSAFAPIVAPTQLPWGRKALAGYLGPDETVWARHDACALMRARGWHGDILIDQGDADAFLERELRPDLFAEACAEADVALTLRMQPGYDHSYYCIASFIDDHLAWHAARLV